MVTCRAPLDLDALARQFVQGLAPLLSGPNTSAEPAMGPRGAARPDSSPARRHHRDGTVTPPSPVSVVMPSCTVPRRSCRHPAGRRKTLVASPKHSGRSRSQGIEGARMPPWRRKRRAPFCRASLEVRPGLVEQDSTPSTCRAAFYPAACMDSVVGRLVAQGVGLVDQLGQTGAPFHRSVVDEMELGSVWMDAPHPVRRRKPAKPVEALLHRRQMFAVEGGEEDLGVGVIRRQFDGGQADQNLTRILHRSGSASASRRPHLFGDGRQSGEDEEVFSRSNHRRRSFSTRPPRRSPAETPQTVRLYGKTPRRPPYKGTGGFRTSLIWSPSMSLLFFSDRPHFEAELHFLDVVLEALERIQFAIP